MNIYRLSNGAYIRTRADLPPSIAAWVDPADAAEMAKARAYFRECGLAA